MNDKRKTTGRASRKKSPLPKKKNEPTKTTEARKVTLDNNELTITTEITLPDVNQAIKEQFVCHHCESNRKTFCDVKKYIPHLIESQTLDPQLLQDILEKPDDYITFICASCDKFFIIHGATLSNLLLLEGLNNTWNKTRRIRLNKNNDLKIV